MTDHKTFLVIILNYFTWGKILATSLLDIYWLHRGGIKVWRAEGQNALEGGWHANGHKENPRQIRRLDFIISCLFPG